MPLSKINKAIRNFKHMKEKDKKFIREIEKKVLKTIKSYKLVSNKDKVLVALSGQKDSTTTLYVLNKKFKHVEALLIDMKIGRFSQENLRNAKEFCKRYGLKLRIKTLEDFYGRRVCYIREMLRKNKYKVQTCSICGILRRTLINNIARKMRFDRVATGHNIDDEAESIMMNLIRGNFDLGLKLGPKTGVVSDKKFVERIKPIYFLSNEETKRFTQLMGWRINYEDCSCSFDAFRRKVRKGFLESDVGGDEKKNILNNFLIIKKKILKDRKTEINNIKYCRYCKEPSRNNICGSCGILLKAGLFKNV